MTQEEKYKLALFAVVRNSTVMPLGLQMGKDMTEINRMAKQTCKEVLDICDFERLKESYDAAE